MARTSSTDWTFSEDAADRAVRFFEDLLVLTKGPMAGHPFRLLPWQRDDVVRPMFGRLRSDGFRIVREVWVELGKKNGKTPLAAGLALQGLFADAEAGAEVYVVASNKKQAGGVFNLAAAMVEASPLLSKRSKVYRSRHQHNGLIHVPKSDSTFQVLSADAGGNDGVNASRVIYDEVHRAQSREMHDMLVESGIARSQPLFIALTTAGIDSPTSLAKQKHDYAVSVAEGRVADPTFLPVLYFNSPDADWRSRDTWRRANPSMGDRSDVAAGDAVMAEEDLEAEIPKLEASPDRLLSFKRLRLNMWMPDSSGDRLPFLSLEQWDACAGLALDDRLDGLEAHVGVDKASSIDIAAVKTVVVWPPGECPHHAGGNVEACYQVVGGGYFIPVETVSGSRDWSKPMQHQIRSWADRGLVTITDGEIIDDRDLIAHLDGLAHRFDVRQVAKDPWQSLQLGVELEERGVLVWDHGQTFRHMSPASKKLRDLVLSGRLHHDGDPVLRWMVGNTVLKTDTDENIKPDRKQSAGKIDGVVALIEAVAAATAEEADATTSIVLA